MNEKVQSVFDIYQIGRTIQHTDDYTVAIAKSLSTDETFWLKIQKKNEIIKAPNPFSKLNRLNHPGLVKCADVFEDSKNFYAAYHLPKGNLLIDIMRRSGKFREDRASKIISQILQVLSYLHDNNIALICLSLNTVYVDDFLNVQLLDFNFTGSYESEMPYETFPNPIQLAPPEYFSMHRYIASLADSWALGVLLHSMLSGGYPWGNIPHEDAIPSMISIVPQMPNGISASCINFIQRTIEIDTSKRYSIHQCISHLWIMKASKHTRTGSTPANQNGSKQISSFLRQNALSSLRTSAAIRQMPRSNYSLNSMSSYDQYHIH